MDKFDKRKSDCFLFIFVKLWINVHGFFLLDKHVLIFLVNSIFSFSSKIFEAYHSPPSISLKYRFTGFMISPVPLLSLSSSVQLVTGAAATCFIFTLLPLLPPDELPPPPPPEPDELPLLPLIVTVYVFFCSYFRPYL